LDQHLNRNLKKSNPNEIIPIITSGIPTQRICFCIGAGINTGYNWRLGKNVILSLSTRSILMDIWLLREEANNPVLPINQRRNTNFSVDLIRSEYQLELGVKFKIW